MTKVTRKQVITTEERKFIDAYTGGDKIQAKTFGDFLSALRMHFLDIAATGNTANFKIFNTGILSIDLLIGGIPSGVTEIYGPPDSLRSSLVVAIGAHSKSDVLYLNTDNKEFRWFVKSPELFNIVNGDYNTHKLLKDALHHGLNGLIVIDSITALNRGKNTIKTVIKHLPSRPEVRMIVINNMGYSRFTYRPEPLGSDELHSLASLILRGATLDSKFYGTRVLYEVMKPKSQEKVKIPICYTRDANVSNEIYLVELAIDLGVVKRQGSMFRFEGKDWRFVSLIESQEIMFKIWDNVVKVYGSEIRLKVEDYIGTSLKNREIKN